MRVSELARRAGISTKAVRFYEAEGILPVAARAANGYREYTEADACRLRIVVGLRNLGLDLAESGRLADLCAADRCDDMTGELAARVLQRRREVAAARAELDHLDTELAALERALASGRADPGTDCAARDHLLGSDRLPRLVVLGGGAGLDLGGDGQRPS